MKNYGKLIAVRKENKATVTTKTAEGRGKRKENVDKYQIER